MAPRDDTPANYLETIFFIWFDPFYRVGLAHGTLIRCTDYPGTTVRKLHTTIYGRDYHSVHIYLPVFFLLTKVILTFRFSSQWLHFSAIDA